MRNDNRMTKVIGCAVLAAATVFTAVAEADLPVFLFCIKVEVGCKNNARFQIAEVVSTPGQGCHT